MRNQKVLDMAYMSVILTIIIILTFTPFGYITFPFNPLVSGTIVHIPVLIACFYFDKKIGTFAGLAFGVSSWIVALTRAATPIEFVFRNPIASVLPRVLFAFIAVILFKGLYKVIKNKPTSLILASALSTLIHTALVLPILAILGPDKIAQIYQVSEVNTEIILDMFKFTLIYNTIFETVLAAIIVPPIVLALKSINSKNNDDSLINNLEE